VDLIKQIFDTPFIKDHYQEQYFVIESYQQLFDSIPEIEKELENRMYANYPRKHFVQNDVEIKYQLANS
jgi:phenylalanine-4-hydroxylase